MQSAVRITSASRVCVPAPIRKELQIEAGDAIEVSVSSLKGDERLPITARMYTNGRITVPIRVREALDLEEGDLIEIDVRHPVIVE